MVTWQVRRLLFDLQRLGVDEYGVPLKAVVFSQHRSAVKHLDFVLAHAGVRIGIGPLVPIGPLGAPQPHEPA